MDRLIVTKLRGRPGEIIEGLRYYAQVAHRSGRAENIVGRLRRCDDGSLWFDPAPRNRRSYALAGRATYQVKLLGRVIAKYMRED